MRCPLQTITSIDFFLPKEKLSWWSRRALWTISINCLKRCCQLDHHGVLWWSWIPWSHSARHQHQLSKALLSAWSSWRALRDHGEQISCFPWPHSARHEHQLFRYHWVKHRWNYTRFNLVQPTLRSQKLEKPSLSHFNLEMPQVGPLEILTPKGHLKTISGWSSLSEATQSNVMTTKKWHYFSAATLANMTTYSHLNNMAQFQHQ